MKTSGRDASWANTTAFSVLPSVSVALALPALIVIVAAGASKPYCFGGPFCSGASPCICADDSRSMAPSTAA